MKSEVALIFLDQLDAEIPLPSEFEKAIVLKKTASLERRLEAILDSTGARTVHCLESDDRKTSDRLTGFLLARDCEIVWHLRRRPRRKASGSRPSKTPAGRRRDH